MRPPHPFRSAAWQARRAQVKASRDARHVIPLKQGTAAHDGNVEAVIMAGISCPLPSNMAACDPGPASTSLLDLGKEQEHVGDGNISDIEAPPAGAAHRLSGGT